MKLLMVNALYPPHQVGGAERSVALLAEALAKDDVEVHVATLWRGTDEASVMENGVMVHRLPLDQTIWPWQEGPRSIASRAMWHVRDRANAAAARRLDRLVGRLLPDLVHGHVLTGFGGSVWKVARSHGIAVAQTLRDYALICSRSALFRHGRKCERRCLDCRLLTASTQAGSQLVDAVAGNSHYTLDAHRAAGRFEGVDGRRLFNIVPLPVPGMARRSHGKGPLRFGFLGRIEAEKGIGLLLDALPLIGRDDWRLSIGGIGKGAAQLKARWPDPRVTWCGKVDAGDFYASIDVLVVPSRWPEPLPRTLIEAAAYGCGVIAINSGGISEVIDVPACAVLVRDNAAALAAAMCNAIDEPQWRVRLDARVSLARFSEAAVVLEHHDFYEAARRRARERGRQR